MGEFSEEKVSQEGRGREDTARGAGPGPAEPGAAGGAPCGVGGSREPCNWTSLDVVRRSAIPGLMAHPLFQV